jgi:hypothetical protein
VSLSLSFTFSFLPFRSPKAEHKQHTQRITKHAPAQREQSWQPPLAPLFFTLFLFLRFLLHPLPPSPLIPQVSAPRSSNGRARNHRTLRAADQLFLDLLSLCCCCCYFGSWRWPTCSQLSFPSWLCPPICALILFASSPGEKKRTDPHCACANSLVHTNNTNNNNDAHRRSTNTPSTQTRPCFPFSSLSH